MNCPKCGTVIPPDKVFCPNCGYTVQIVPDFELDVEESIAETRNEMADTLDNLIGPDGTRRVSGNDAVLPGLLEKLRLIRTAAVILVIAAVISALGILAAPFLFGKEEATAANVLQQASAAYLEGKYEEAVSLYEEVFAGEVGDEEEETWLESDEVNYAKALIRLGRIEEGENALKGILSADPKNRGVFEELLTLYQDNGWYEAINQLIREDADPAFQKEYKGYLTAPPVFSVPSGTYDDVFSLELTDLEQGEIYYTLDGSTPTELSELYTGPIAIEEGETVVTAIYYNRFGIASEPVKMTYEVHFELPETPQLSPAPGTYTQPEYITVTSESPGLIYYTLDGSEPTEDSALYVEGDKIPMALGKSVLSFLPVSEKGVKGEVLKAVYQLNLTGACTPEDASNYVTASLVMAGALSDIYGTVPGAEGHYRYECKNAAREGSRTYYIVDEIFEKTSGSTSRTGTYYAVDVMSGMMYRARKGSDGRFSFSLFY